MNKKILKCSYPKCNKVAEVRLGMNDPDAEMKPYCKECAEKVRMNTFMAIAKTLLWQSQNPKLKGFKNAR